MKALQIAATQAKYVRSAAPTNAELKGNSLYTFTGTAIAEQIQAIKLLSWKQRVYFIFTQQPICSSSELGHRIDTLL